MEFPAKEENITSKEDDKNGNKPDELIVFYHFKCCSCIIILFIFVYSILIFAPVLLICFCCMFAYKRVIIIDKIKNILISCDKGMIPCCKLTPKTFFLNTIKKVIIYITWKNDEKIGFNKLYFMNCDLISNEGMKENLFIDVKYNENKLNEYLQFFRKYFDTEFIPADNANPDFLGEQNSQTTFITNQNANIDIVTKPDINEDAAMPINVQS